MPNRQATCTIVLTRIPPPKGAISGMVMDQDSRPLSGVSVSIPGVIALTGADGLYTFLNLEPGSYTVHFTKPGYNTVDLVCDVKGGQTTTLNAVLTTTVVPPTKGSISGKVTDTSGYGISGATVTYGTPTSIIGTTTTDGSGNFKFTEVVPGSYMATASKTGYISATTSVAVTAGNNTYCVLTLAPEPPSTGCLGGTVTEKMTGALLSGVTVTINGSTCVTGTDGTYAFSHLPVGTFTVTYEKVGYKPYNTSVTIVANTNRILNVALEKNLVRKWMHVGPPNITTNSGYYTKIATDSYGQVYVAYMDCFYGGRISVIKFNGYYWQYVGVPGFSAGPASHISLFIYNNTPYVSFSDSYFGGRVCVGKYNGAYWEYVGSPGFSANPASYTSLYVYNGICYVAFKKRLQGDSR